MKKALMFGMVFLGISTVFAFPFRPSCGKTTVEVIGTRGMTNQQLANYLAQINYDLCDVWPSHIIIYSH